LAVDIANFGGGKISSFRHTSDHDSTVGKDATDPTVFEHDDVADIGVTHRTCGICH
jgi:hypothetical protein